MTISDWPVNAGIDIASEIANLPEGATHRRGMVLFGVSGTIDEIIDSAIEAGVDTPSGLPNLPAAARVDSVIYDIARDGTVKCSEGYEPIIVDGFLFFKKGASA